ncbi:hypothetical protein C4D60_Mb08t27890 [Musa balbisiana]|uniref:Uncharacterized protein n=1 Tax=Musa balbisiana TaxID=52838 RepID=A0A4S8K700_MUSBA|nr:hypothetical protein C4D60_Mb08t27890 [Musa balbisiana]
MEMLSNPPTHPGAPSQGTVGCGIRTTLLASLIGRDPSSTLVMVIQSYNHVCLGMKQRRGGRQAFMAEEDCSFLSRSKHEMSLIEFSGCQLRMNKIAIRVLNTIIRKLIGTEETGGGGGGFKLVESN